MQIIYNNIRTDNAKAVAQTVQPAKTAQNTSHGSPSFNGVASFKEVLGNALEESSGKLQFSKHAYMRLSAREIALSTEQMRRVEGGVSMAREKGIKDSLVLVDNVALVINVRNKMVITAMEQADDHIFTNIDGAVIV